MYKKEKLEEQHQLDIEEETDEKFFRRVRRVKKVEKHMHEMLGHRGWKTIKRGLAQVQGYEGLVKYLDGVGDNRHFTACELTKVSCHLFQRARPFA